MWKKFLAVMATVVLVSTNIASAAIVGGPLPVDYITNYNVSNTSFNPTAGESTKVIFTLNQAASLYVYAIDSNFTVYPIVGTATSPVATAAGNASYAWFGRSPNAAAGVVLPNGSYDLKVFAFDGVASVVDFDQKSVTVVSTPVAPPVNTSAPKISNLKVDPVKFSAVKNEDTEISFDADKDGYLTVTVKKGTSTVRTFTDYDGNDFYRTTDDHSINWNGKDNQGVKVANGTYTIEVKAKNDQGENTASTTVEVAEVGSGSSGVIEDFTLDPSNTWDPTDEELQIEFELTSSVRSLTIDAKLGNKVVEIIDDRDLDDDDYDETWDGTDDDGDYVKEGLWEIIIRADGDTVSKKVQVKYEDTKISEAFVSKETFDPSEDEMTNLVFKIAAAADVTVEVFKGSKRELTLVNEEAVKKNRWYTVAWDGKDEDGEEVDFGKDWKFKITAENMTENDVQDNFTVEVDVEEDDVSEKKSNILRDYTDPVVFDDERDDSVTVSYDIDEDAEVFLAVYEGKSTTGKAEIELLDYVKQSAGEHTVEWNGKDDKNKKLKDGIYSYKIISRTSGGNKETEIGRFVVGNAGDGSVNPPTPPAPPTPPTPPTPPPVPPFPPSSNCGGYWDTTYTATADYELCQAIEWVTSQGIFSGYADGSFGAHKLINRAEVLKTIFSAFPQANIIHEDGTNAGFWDLDPYSWYMPYVLTGKFYGLLHGYPDGSAKLSNTITRIELLKFALEASEAFTGYQVPKSYSSNYGDVSISDPSQAWFRDYAAVAYQYILFKEHYQGSQVFLGVNDLVTRGEVALLLYRMNQNGILGSGVNTYGALCSDGLPPDALYGCPEYSTPDFTPYYPPVPAAGYEAPVYSPAVAPAYNYGNTGTYNPSYNYGGSNYYPYY